MTDLTDCVDNGCGIEECLANGCLILAGKRTPADLVPSHLQPHAYSYSSRQGAVCDCILSLPAAPQPEDLADEVDRVYRIGKTRVDQVTCEDQDFYGPHPLRRVDALYLPTVAAWLRTKTPAPDA